jgi:hypothetical protein
LPDFIDRSTVLPSAARFSEVGNSSTPAIVASPPRSPVTSPTPGVSCTALNAAWSMPTAVGLTM